MTIPARATYSVPVIKKDQPDDTYKFQPLPKPSGTYPYRMDLETVLPGYQNKNKLVFHMAGDTGSLRSPDFQREIALAMAGQYKSGLADDRPLFLYHLGDVVYNYGEAGEYAGQFFRPYECYPGPILAIAGNHDSDVNPLSPVPYQSLDAFTAVFCDTVQRLVVFSGNSKRKSMVQPNVYWTLEIPLATIIGLHSNVPKYGIVTNEQRDWFIEELKAANLQRPHKALIICLHHAPYSADTNHGSSLPMIGLLEGVFAETGIRPDLVVSGHVHNYQRFSKLYADGLAVTYIVAGGGGYDELHPMALIDDDRFTADNPLFKDIRLESYCDDRHGFLKIAIEKGPNGLVLVGEYYAVNNNAKTESDDTTVLADSFRFDLR